MIKMAKRPGVEEFALDRHSGIETAGLISRRELVKRSTAFGAVALLGRSAGS